MTNNRKLTKIILSILSIAMLLSGCKGNNEPKTFQDLAASKGYEIIDLDNKLSLFDVIEDTPSTPELEDQRELLQKATEGIQSEHAAIKSNEKGELHITYIKCSKPIFAATLYFYFMLIIASTSFGQDRTKNFVSDNIEDFKNEQPSLGIVGYAYNDTQSKDHSHTCFVTAFDEKNSAMAIAILEPNEDSSKNLDITPKEQLEYVISELESLGFKEHKEEQPKE